jgi:hypothetical protein
MQQQGTMLVIGPGAAHLRRGAVAVALSGRVAGELLVDRRACRGGRSAKMQRHATARVNRQPVAGCHGSARPSLIASLIQLRPEPFGAHHEGQATEVTDPHDLRRTPPRRLGKRMGTTHRPPSAFTRQRRPERQKRSPAPVSGADRECWRGWHCWLLRNDRWRLSHRRKISAPAWGPANAAFSCRYRGAMDRRREVDGCSLPK